MPKTRTQKESELAWLQDIFKQMKSMFFADFTNLKVKEMQDLRSRLRQENSLLKVANKKIFKIALLGEKENFKKIASELQVDGPISLAFGLEDEIAPARILAKFKKEHKDFKILGGILGDQYINSEAVGNIAKLPGKDEMRARAIGTIAAPLSGFVNVLAGNIRNLIYILKNISEKGVE